MSSEENVYNAKYSELIGKVSSESLSDSITKNLSQVRQIWPNFGKLVGEIALFTRYKASFSGGLFTTLHNKLVEADEKSLAKAITQAATITCGLTLDTSGDESVFKSNKLIRNNIGEEESLKYIDHLLAIDNDKPLLITVSGAPLKLFLKLLVSDSGKITVKIAKAKKASGSTVVEGEPLPGQEPISNVFDIINELVLAAPDDTIKNDLLTVKDLLRETLNGIQSTDVEFNKVIKGILKTL